MKKYLLVIGLITLMFASCEKPDITNDTEGQEQLIDKFDIQLPGDR